MRVESVIEVELARDEAADEMLREGGRALEGTHVLVRKASSVGVFGRSCGSRCMANSIDVVLAARLLGHLKELKLRKTRDKV